MALIECPECKRAVSDRADACPGCGHPIATDAAGSANKSPAPQQSPKPTKDQAKDQDPVKLSDPKAPTENIADKEEAWEMTWGTAISIPVVLYLLYRVANWLLKALTGLELNPADLF